MVAQLNSKKDLKLKLILTIEIEIEIVSIFLFVFFKKLPVIIGMYYL